MSLCTRPMIIYKLHLYANNAKLTLALILASTTKSDVICRYNKLYYQNIYGTPIIYHWGS